MGSPLRLTTAGLGDARERWQKATWSDKLFVVALVLLAAGSLAPIWRARFMPLLDEPTHLSAAYVVHSINDPATRVREYYERVVAPMPYATYYVLEHIAATIAGFELGNKLVQSLYVLAVPAAALAWAIRTGRSKWLAVFAFPLAYTYSWSNGFQPFNVGFAVFLWAGVAADAFLERPRWPLGAALLLLSLACDLSHPLALAAFYTTLAGLVVAHRPPLRRVGAALLLVAPSVGLFVYQVLRPRALLPQDRGSGPLYEGYHESPIEMLRNLPAYALDSISGHWDLAVFWALVGLAALLFATGLQKALRPKEMEGFAGAVRHYRVALVMAAMLALYLILPLHLQKPFDWWFVSGRYAPFACFFAFLLPSGELRGARLALAGLAAAASLSLTLVISEKYAQFDERAKPFFRMVERTPPASNILFLSLKPRQDPAINIEAYRAFAAYLQILRGGYSANSWSMGFPIKIKKTLPGPPWHTHEAFNPRTHTGPYQYIIVRNETRPVLGPVASEWCLVEKEGLFTFYARSGDPQCPAPPPAAP